ncbi:hypothetical protein M569_14402, partial [Genlisea aurea]
SLFSFQMESLFSLMLIILVNLAVGILPHVDNFAHLGGFVTGFLLGFVLLIRPQFGYIKDKTRRYYHRHPHGAYSLTSPRPKYKTYQYALLLLAVLLLLAWFSTGLQLLLGGVNGNEHCSWCHYLSCVPTPLWSCEARCSSSQYENQLNLTCMDNNRSKFYLLGNDTAASQIQKLCVQLC